jgi:hypothetical protein
MPGINPTKRQLIFLSVLQTTVWGSPMRSQLALRLQVLRNNNIMLFSPTLIRPQFYICLYFGQLVLTFVSGSYNPDSHLIVMMVHTYPVSTGTRKILAAPVTIANSSLCAYEASNLFMLPAMRLKQHQLKIVI